MLHFTHSADFHFGRTLHSSIDTETGLQSSLVNDMQALDELIDIAESRGCRIFVWAGDVFDKIHIPNAVRREVAKRVRRIINTMHLVAIVGTHDRSHSKFAAHTISDWAELVNEKELSRLHIFDRPDSFIFVNEEGKEEGQVIVIPEPTKGILEGKSYFDYATEFFESIEIRKELPILTVAHLSVSGTRIGEDEIDITNFCPDQSLPSEFFDDKKYIDYVALGHIHVTQELGETGKIVYPGSLNYVDFSEVNLPKGGYVARIEDDKTMTKEFVRITSPVPMRELRLNLAGEESPMEIVRERIEKEDLKGTIAKVILTVDEGDVQKIDKNAVRKLLVDTVSYSVAYDVNREIKRRDATITQGTSKVKAFDRFLQLQNYEDSDKEVYRSQFMSMLERLEERKKFVK